MLAELKRPARHEHGNAWWECERERSLISDQLKQNVRLTKIRKLMRRQGVDVPYSTLHRFAVQQLGFGKRSAAVLTGGKGIDYVVDTTAVAALLRQAAEALALRGTLATVGAVKPGTEVTFEIGSSLIKGWVIKPVVVF